MRFSIHDLSECSTMTVDELKEFAATIGGENIRGAVRYAVGLYNEATRALGKLLKHSRKNADLSSELIEIGKMFEHQKKVAGSFIDLASNAGFIEDRVRTISKKRAKEILGGL